MSIQPQNSFNVTDSNRLLIYRAYDDGDGNTLNIEPGEKDGWFIGTYDGDTVMEGIEADGMLFSICPQSGGGRVAVLIGREIEQNVIGTVFSSTAEARAYVQGLIAG